MVYHIPDSGKMVDWKEDAVNFIADFEWFRENAYWDAKVWSIWYGTPSYKWEVITKEEAIQRKKDHLQTLYELVDKECYNDNQKIALVSYMYNVWVNAMNIKSYVQNCDKENVKYIMTMYGWTINWVYSKWLAKRRNIEISKFNTL